MLAASLAFLRWFEIQHTSARYSFSETIDAQSHGAMVRMKSKATWIFFPRLAHRTEWCLPPERFQVLAEVVALNECLDMLP